MARITLADGNEISDQDAFLRLAAALDALQAIGSLGDHDADLALADAERSIRRARLAMKAKS